MNEDQLRALIRQAVAYHLEGRQVGNQPMVRAQAPTPTGPHPSHRLFMLPSDADGACVIEPAVACNHCGYCKSYGH